MASESAQLRRPAWLHPGRPTLAGARLGAAQVTAELRFTVCQFHFGLLFGFRCWATVKPRTRCTFASVLEMSRSPSPENKSRACSAHPYHTVSIPGGNESTKSFPALPKSAPSPFDMVSVGGDQIGRRPQAHSCKFRARSACICLTQAASLSGLGGFTPVLNACAVREAAT